MPSEPNKGIKSLTLDKINFKTKLSGDKGGYIIMIKDQSLGRHILINTYTPKNGALKYLK